RGRSSTTTSSRWRSSTSTNTSTLARERDAPPKTRGAALVTGASRGIGRAIAEALGGVGFDVAVNYRSDGEAADAVVGCIRRAGRRGGGGGARPARRAREQRGRLLLQAARRDDGRRVAARHRQQPVERLLHEPGRAGGDARAAARLHRQRRPRAGAARPRGAE